MKQHISWKTGSRAATPNSPYFIKRNGILPSPQKPAAIPYLHPPVAWRSIEMPTFHLRLCLPSFLSCLPTKTLNVFFLSPVRVICLPHIAIPGLWHRQQTIMLHNMSFPPASYQFPVPLTHTLFPTPRSQVSSNLCSSLTDWDRVWNPLKTACNITFYCI